MLFRRFEAARTETRSRIRGVKTEDVSRRNAVVRSPSHAREVQSRARATVGGTIRKACRELPVTREVKTFASGNGTSLTAERVCVGV
jgi:hypothetical protein